MAMEMSFNMWKEDLAYQEQLGHKQDDPDWATKWPFNANEALWRNFRRIMNTLSQDDQMIVFAVVNFYVDKYGTQQSEE